MMEDSLELHSTEQSNSPELDTKEVKVKLKDSPSCLEWPNYYGRSKSPGRRGYRHNSFDTQNSEAAASFAKQNRIATLDLIVESLEQIDTKQLKDTISMPRNYLTLAVKEIHACSPERFLQIREKVARTTRLKSLEFKKDVLTKKGVLKILGKKA